MSTAPDGRPVSTAPDGRPVSTAPDGRPVSTAPDGRPVSTAPDGRPEGTERLRLRLRFTKQGKIRFTSHRDVARMWERALRRSRLPLAYSQGFVPHPLVSFGLALPTGCESLGEYLDVRLEPGALGETPLAELPATLSPLLPEGIEVTAAALVDEAEGSLQQEVASCDWELEVPGVPGEELAERVERLLAAPVLTVRRERKGRQTDDDIRPAVLAMSVTSPDGHLRAEVATHPRGVRPADLLAALGTVSVPGRACRTHQWIERDGARFEPLALSGHGPGAGAAQHARRAIPHVRDGDQPDPGGSPAGGVTPR
ncbi:MAG TPA: TIGR03936 family radical SAM-associated protein [Acidimicrobiales bacterium]|nr:TIGR03936 family radical SAM-associated protein [Acidimicrobiales bacterium]